MLFIYQPQGVCSTHFIFVIKHGIIENVRIVGGCMGNLTGICVLLKGMSVDDVIVKFRGIRCGDKRTSCPDQIARALQEWRSTHPNDDDDDDDDGNDNDGGDAWA